MAYEVWNRQDWAHSNCNPLTTTITYDMALIQAEDFSRQNQTMAVVVIEKNVKQKAKFRALFRNGKMITPQKCNHCHGYADDNCPCKGAGWNPGKVF